MNRLSQSGPKSKQLREQFLVLPENRLAFHSVDLLARRNLPRKSSLVYLAGPSGHGKSLLAKQFLRTALQENSELSSRSATASTFAAEFAEASDEQKIPEFQESYRSTDLLVIEDVQSLASRTETLKQLLFTIDAVVERGGRVLVTANRLPSELARFPLKLINRFHGGVTAVIRANRQPSRAALISHFSQSLQLYLPDKGIQQLARARNVSPRELAAIVLQLDEHTTRTNTELSPAFLEKFLNRSSETKTLTVAAITKAVAAEFGVTLRPLRSKERSQKLALPRQCAMFLCRRLTAANYRQIGDYFGGRDHSTVVHACRRVRTRLPDDPGLRQRLARVEQNIAGPPSSKRE